MAQAYMSNGGPDEPDKSAPPGDAPGAAPDEANEALTAGRGDLARRSISSSSPLLPEAGASGGPLIAVMAVMSFLALIALASAAVVSNASQAWVADLSRTATVQIKSTDADEIDALALAAVAALEGSPYVTSVRAMTREDAAQLLEPWIGVDNLPADLPIPRLIEVDLSPSAPVDLSSLAARVEAAAPGAQLDDHRRWNAQVTRFGNALRGAAWLALALISLATVAIVVFAARAGLAANAEIVDALHLMGAEDRFIARHVQGHFLALALKGSAIGTLGAVTAIVAIAAGAQQWWGGAFLPVFTFTWVDAAWLAAAPASVCLLATGTARLAVLRSLRDRL